MSQETEETGVCSDLRLEDSIREGRGGVRIGSAPIV